MAHETDFLDLYGKLRLEPGCSLDEFKQAYRRNVALWHPDRRRGTRADAIAAARLQRLTAQYGAAMEFYRRHGRLPGAPVVAQAPVAETASAEPAAMPRIDPVASAASGAEAPARARRVASRWWFATVLLGIGAVLWSTWPDGRESDPGEDPGSPVATRADAVPTGTLALGMSPDEVLAIEGEPTRRGTDRWEYGPSWVRFEGDTVVDWHSSPLRALRVGSSRPRP